MRNPKFNIGDAVNLKCGKHRIPAMVTQRYLSWEGVITKRIWHGYTYDVALEGSNLGQQKESVREDHLERLVR